MFYFQAPNNGAPLTRGMSPVATRRGRGRSGLRVAELVSGRAAVRVLGSASLRSELGAVAGRPPGSEAGVEREALEDGTLRSDAAGMGGDAWLR